jgi:NAD(P)-dependent dehydrogenase (short-subunit alcohol dehydrogenase family)
MSEGSIFISGATEGLGLHLAEKFVHSGHSVVFCARTEAKVRETERRLRSFAVERQLISGFVADVTNLNAISGIRTTLESHGVHISSLVCNAGVIGPIDKFLDSKTEEWHTAFNVNLFGAINLVSVFLPAMLERGSGRVVHISGGGATSPLFGMTSYAASKAAAVRFIETVALEYEGTGVTLNSIAPGMLKTQLLDQMLDAGPARIGEKLFSKSSEKSLAETDSTQLAIDLIQFLLSDLSDGITGKLISAEWDNWKEWPKYVESLQSSDMYTLRRITGRDRGISWGDI